MATLGRPRNDETTSNIEEQEAALESTPRSFASKNLQKQMDGETYPAYHAYLQRRDNADMTLTRFAETVYTGNAKSSTVVEWSKKWKWVDRIVDYRRPVIQKIAESVTQLRIKQSVQAAEDITNSLLKVHQEVDKVLDGISESMPMQAAVRMLHENIPHIQRVLGIDFNQIKEKELQLHTSHVIGQIWDVIENKIPVDTGDRLMLPLQPMLKTTQSRMIIDYLKTEEREVLASGPVNCAKTIMSLLYIMALHCAIPGFQSMILRTEAKTIYSTILPQLFNKILALAPKDPRQPFTLYGGDKRPLEINWKNGGTTFFAGLDNSEKVRGAELDLIFHSQLERETFEGAYLDLIGRIEGGRGGNWHLRDGTPFNQLIGDANPASPHHWLKSREKEKQLEFFNFGHEDNPALYYNYGWTPQGTITVNGLKKRYSGYMLERMVYGKWVGASGLVYPMFSKSSHVKPITRDDIGADFQWFLSNDYGGRAPFCYGLWAVNANRNKYILFREVYHTLWPVDEQIRFLKEKVIHDIKPKTMFADWDFQHNTMFEAAKIDITLADKKKLEGIDKVKELLAVPGAIIFNENALVHPPDIELTGKAHCTVDEFYTYSYREEGNLTGVARIDEEPVKGTDHGMDAMRYLIKTLSKVNYIPDFSGVTYRVRAENSYVF